MGRSSEADGSADGAFNGTSAVCLREATAATEVHLREGEVVNGHCTVGRVHLQRREKLLAERPGDVEIVRGRFEFGEVGEERQMRVGGLVAVFERDVDAVHLNTTHTHLTALLPGLPRLAGTRKVKPIRILLKPETVSGSSISWAICKSAPCSRQITTPSPHHSVFYRPDALPAAQPTASKH